MNSLTGPVERCDIGTIEGHLSSLQHDEQNLYILLSKKLITIAMKKNAEKNYESLKFFLDNMGGE